MPRIVAPWEIKRELLTKSEDETDPDFGHKPEERPYPDLLRFGMINLDKPPGPSSHEVTAWVKRILNLKRAGHGGTLEVQVTWPGLSQGDRCSTNSARGSEQGDSSSTEIWERVRLRHEAALRHA